MHLAAPIVHKSDCASQRSIGGGPCDCIAISERPELETLLVDEIIRVPAYDKHDADMLSEAATVKAVTDAIDYEYAVDLAKRLKGVANGIEAYFKPFKQAIDRVKRVVLGAEDAAEAYDKQAARIATLASNWHAAERRRETAEREAAERAAREAAEAEQREKAERLRRVAEHVPDEAVADAIRREAQQVAAAPVAQPKVATTSSIPSTRGFTPSRVTYSARVDSRLELAKAVAAGKVPVDALLPNQAWLNEKARNAKADLGYPGVTVLKDSTPVVRA
jgi:hypothetical protein